MMIDYHLHTYLSGDSEQTVMAVCERAVEIGLTEIAFTEHIDFDPDDLSYGAYDYRKATDEIEAARERFGGDLTIRKGIEVDYRREYRNRIKDILANNRFDYVVGAAHYVGGVILEDDAYFAGKTEDEAYLPYFDAAEEAAATGMFDAFAHLDFCKRRGVRHFGPFPWERYRGEIERVLRAIVATDMALEVNTSGLRRDPRETLPATPTVRLFRELGGSKVVVGSDAHQVRHIGFGIEQGLQVITGAGFNELATFENRVCRLVPIEVPVGEI